MSDRTQRFAFLDALRGLAAMSVLVFHFHGELTAGGTVRRLPAFLDAIVRHGDLGVEVFFVLSGFVIMWSVREAWITPRYLGRFALRRALRLDPPYWTIIFVTFALMIAQRRVGAAPAKALIANLFYLDNLLGLPSIVKVGWTLCLEIQFYLLAILLRGLAQRLGRPLGLGRALVIVHTPLFVWSLAIAAGLTSLPTTGLFLEAWHLFVAGAVVAAVVAKELPPIAAYGVFALMLGACAIRWDLRTPVTLAAAGAILVVAARGQLATLGRGRVLAYLGRISYSLYLVHPLVGSRLIRIGQHRFGDPPPAIHAWGLFVGAVAASIVAAHALNVLVEGPSQRFARRVRLPAA